MKFFESELWSNNSDLGLEQKKKKKSLPYFSIFYQTFFIIFYSTKFFSSKFLLKLMI